MGSGVTGVGGVFLRAGNPAELARWYAEKLGVPLDGGLPAQDHEGMVSATFTWRDERDPERVGMTVWAVFPRDSDYLGDGPVMVNYRVDDLDATLEALAAEGVWIDPDRQDHEYGRFAWIKDPEGNRIELWQAIED